MIKNASKSISPNSGWPESAIAGALLIRLGGPKTYNGIVSKGYWLNSKYNDPTIGDFHQGIYLYKKTIFFTIFIITISTIFQYFKS